MGTRKCSVFIGLVLWIVSSCPAATLFVDGRVSTCGDGQTWATAYKYLQDALTVARNSDGTITEIWVAAGTYQPDRDCANPNGSRDRASTFLLVSGVSLRGGFAGGEDPATYHLSQRDFKVNPTVLTGDLAGDDAPNFTNNAENAFSVVTNNGTDANTVLDGFKITAANNNNSPSVIGGGFANQSGSPRVVNCTFTANQAFFGGAIGQLAGMPSIANCIIQSNTAYSGGAIYVRGDTVELVNCLVLQNTGTGGRGGAIYQHTGTITASGCSFYGNASSLGSVLYVRDHCTVCPKAALKNCIVWGNSTNVFSPYPSGQNSCMQINLGGTNITSDPLFVNPAAQDFRLQFGSPCIDSGSNAFVPPESTRDLDGNPRIRHNTVDMGAYEYQDIDSHVQPILYVNPAATGGKNGLSWQDAFTSLSDCLNLAARYPDIVDEIWVVGGTHKLAPPGGNQQLTYVVPAGVAIYGGFAGTETTRDQRDFKAHPTILDGDLNGDDDPTAYCNLGDNTAILLTVKNADPATIIDGFVFTASRIYAIQVDQASPTIRNCTFLKNHSTAISVSGGNPTILTCQFLYNRGQFVSCSSGNPILANSLAVNNSYGVSCYGGSSLVATNCTFWSASIQAAEASSVTLTNCILLQSFPMTGNVTVSYSCVPGGCPGTGNINSNPLVQNSSASDFRLSPFSPCVNAGSNEALPAGLSSDLAGAARVVGGKVDIGAFESPDVLPPPPERLYVSANAAGQNNGSSWADAVRQLRDAVGLALQYPGTVKEMWVATGTYNVGLGQASFPLQSGLAVHGGFAGSETLLDQRRPATNLTILSADSSDPARTDDNSAHVLVAIDVDKTAILDGFTVTGAYPHPSPVSSTSVGGGIYILRGSPSVSNCVFERNESDNGGGIYAESSSPTIVNCRFRSNTGFAVSCVQSSPEFVNCAFDNNTQGVVKGVQGSHTRLANCTIAANYGNSFIGGLIASFDSDCSIANSILWDNNSSGSLITGPVEFTYSCVQGGWPGTGNINSDPRWVFAAGGDLRLRRGSPCIDAGDSTLVPTGVVSDNFGAQRFRDDPSTPDTGNPLPNGMGVVDMGAYEYQPASSQRLYVKSSTSAGGNGRDWSSAFQHLQDALNVSQASPDISEIWIAAGVYRPDRDASHPGGTGDRSVSFRLPGAVAIYGGFPGTPGQEDLFSARNPAAYVTYLTGDLAGNDNDDLAHAQENTYQVITAAGVSAATVIDGVTIAGGYPSLTGTQTHGGALRVSNASPTVVNCSIMGNFGTDAVYVSGSPAFTNCCLIRNQTTAIRLYSGSPVFTNCTVTDGVDQDQNSLLYATPTFRNCILWANGPFSAVACSGTITYSCVQGGWTGTGNISADPRLLADGRLHLGSPCIDAGDNTALATSIATDLVGRPRFVDDPKAVDTGIPGTPPRSIVDMGAFEYQPAPAKTLFVRSSAAPSGDGRSWSTAYGFLQDAVRSAQGDPDVTDIWVAAGVYKPDRDQVHPTGTLDRTASFQMISNVAVYGGFPDQADQPVDALARNPSLYPTILKGDLADNDGTGRTSTADNSYHVVSANNVNVAGVLDGFTIIGGYAAGGTVVGSAQGGGVYIVGGSPLIRRCLIKGNFASNCGAGVYNTGAANPTLANCVMASNGNSGTTQGGGFYNDYTSGVNLLNCTFVGNAAKTGGGLYFSYAPYGTTRKVNNCILWGNTGTSSLQIYGTPTVTYSCVQAGFAGAGNISSDPLFVNSSAGDYHLSGPSPCIDAGDPASEYSLEPEPDGGRINMGAYGNTPDAETKGWLLIEAYNQVSRTRVDRTSFDYAFTTTMRNAGTASASNVTATLSSVPANVQIIQGVVSIPSIDAGASGTSTGTFTIRVDRSTPVSTLAISWKVTSSVGPQMIASSLLLDATLPGDLNDDGAVDGTDTIIFEACGTGPTVSYDPPNLAAGCNFPGALSEFIPADFDTDHDVDQEDFGIFQTYLGLTRPVTEP